MMMEREGSAEWAATSQPNCQRSTGPKTPEGNACAGEADVEAAFRPASFSPTAIATGPRLADVEAAFRPASFSFADVDVAFRPASSPQSTVATEQRTADEPADRSGDASFSYSAENPSENPLPEREPVVRGAVGEKNEKKGSIKPDNCCVINNMTLKTNLEQTW